MNVEQIEHNLDLAEQLVLSKGGEGSGNFDHAGVPGEVGGSSPSGSGVSLVVPPKGTSDADWEHGIRVEGISTSKEVPMSQTKEKGEAASVHGELVSRGYDHEESKQSGSSATHNYSRIEGNDAHQLNIKEKDGQIKGWTHETNHWTTSKDPETGHQYMASEKTGSASGKDLVSLREHLHTYDKAEKVKCILDLAEQLTFGTSDLEKIHRPHKVETMSHKWKVVDDDGKLYGTHDTEHEADAQLAALYANKAE